MGIYGKNGDLLENYQKIFSINILHLEKIYFFVPDMGLIQIK